MHAGRVDRGVDELTPQEEAVAALVAQGRTNRQVAAELFLSPKTVQYHLTRTYAKLGVRSRSELAALRHRRVRRVTNTSTAGSYKPSKKSDGTATTSPAT